MCDDVGAFMVEMSERDVVCSQLHTQRWGRITYLTLPGGGGLGVPALLAFQAVGREGAETVVFTLAVAFSTNQQNALLGAGVGLAEALLIAFVVYRLGHRLNLGRSFTVVGGLLMVFAAGLLVDAIQNLQELGWLPIGMHVLWHTSVLLSEDGTWGDIAHTFLGYADSPSALQVATYLTYITLALVGQSGCSELEGNDGRRCSREELASLGSSVVHFVESASESWGTVRTTWLPSV